MADHELRDWARHIWQADLCAISMLLGRCEESKQICLVLTNMHLHTLSACFFCRDPALVEAFVYNEGQNTVSPVHKAWLEIWADDGLPLTSANRYQQLVITDNQVLGQMTISLQECSPVKSGRDQHGPDLILGSPAMLKLSRGIDTTSGRVCNVKRRMRK